MRLQALVGRGRCSSWAPAAWIGWSIFSDTELNLLTATWFQEISDRLRFTEQRLLPSWWLSAGLLEASRPPVRVYEGYQPWSESLLYFLLLLANALFLSLVAGWLAAKTYRRSYSRLQSEHTVNRKTRRLAQAMRWCAMC